MATYVYGIAGDGTLRAPLRAQGMPDGQSPVAVISAEGAAAIVGRYSGPAMSGLPQQELLRRLAIHQRVIEDALHRGDVLPVRFGTVLTCDEEVRTLLAGGAAWVRASLARFCGLVEIEVAATWDLERALREAAEDPEAAKARSEAALASPEESLAQKIKLGKAVKGVLDRRRADYLQRLLRVAGGLADSAVPNVLLSDELVFNVAFLLRRQALPEFEAAIDRLDTELAGSLQLRVIGPLPPYTFGTVSITRFDAERLAAGRALLGLEGEISEEAVLSRYRQRAMEFHPDRHHGGDDAAARFAALNAARADLLAYARDRARTGTGSGGAVLLLSFGRDGQGGAPGNGRR